MYRMRRWSVRNARYLKKRYSAIERILVGCSPLLRRTDEPFTTIASAAMSNARTVQAVEAIS